MRHVVAVLVAVLAVAGAPRAGAFDYYVLALSWTPAWCARAGDGRDAAHCASGSGVGWSVHGLWPQHDDGGWPEFCATDARNPSRRQTAAMADLMGSGGAAWHQWNRHGRCSGLSARDYFALTRRAFALLEVPEPPPARPAALRAAMLDANPNLGADGLVVTCARGMLAELRVCLDRDLEPRACDAGLRARACRAGRVRVPPAR